MTTFGGWAGIFFVLTRTLPRPAPAMCEVQELLLYRYQGHTSALGIGFLRMRKAL